MRATWPNFTGTPAFGDRLLLNPARVEAMARGLEEVAALPDPLARTLAEWTPPERAGHQPHRRSRSACSA